MISPLFVQRTIRREKLNKQIHRVKVDRAPKSNRVSLIRRRARRRAAARKIGRAPARAARRQYLDINRRRFTNSDAISIIAGHFVNV
jgi:hypothetical protein